MIDIVKKVCGYEKSVQVDIKSLQVVMTILSLTLILINIENIKLGKLSISLVVMIIAVVGVFSVFALQYYQTNYNFILRLVITVFIIFAIPISIYGANDGFALLWYMLLPVITIILMGIPSGAPLCIGFGIFVMAIFWTPLNQLLLYEYPKDYMFYYPFFYWAFCIIVVIMDIFYKLYKLQQIENEKNLEAEVKKAVAETQNLMVASVATISQMLDEKDGYTQEHSKRVAAYSKLIAQNLESTEFTEEEISLIYRSALLHDIGKIAIPDCILNKPDRLTDEEYEIMKKHTVWGKEILSGLKFLPQADLGASYHHERYDGRGYPYGLKGEQLPLTARIISAADALDAMSSNRCYRKSCETGYIIDEFKKGRGTQFDADIADTVIDLVREGKILV